MTPNQTQRYIVCGGTGLFSVYSGLQVGGGQQLSKGVMVTGIEILWLEFI